MDADVIVVGAGIVGSCAVRAARAAGASVLHLAGPQPPHSLAAAAITRPTYLPADTRPALPRTLENYGQAVACTGAYVTSYRTPGQRPKPQTLWWLIDPVAPLTAPDATVTVTAAHPGTVETEEGRRYTGRAVILATGATSPLSPAGTVTWGVTWTGPTEALAYPDALRVHHWAPYKAISAGPAGGVARVGSSSGRTREAAEVSGRKLLTTAHEAGLISTPDVFTPLTGARLKTSTTVHRLGPAFYWVGGHHRNGYALGPADATRATHLALLEAAL